MRRGPASPQRDTTDTLAHRPIVKILLNRVKLNPPAEKRDVADLLTRSKLKLPLDYLAFLLYGNGGKGYVGNAYIDLWPAEDLIKVNEEYRAAGLSNGFFVFGVDGLGDAFAFDCRLQRPIICRVPFMSQEPGSAELLGVSFHEFLESLLKE